MGRRGRGSANVGRSSADGATAAAHGGGVCACTASQGGAGACLGKPAPLPPPALWPGESVARVDEARAGGEQQQSLVQPVKWEGQVRRVGQEGVEGGAFGGVEVRGAGAAEEGGAARIGRTVQQDTGLQGVGKGGASQWWFSRKGQGRAMQMRG